MNFLRLSFFTFLLILLAACARDNTIVLVDGGNDSTVSDSGGDTSDEGPGDASSDSGRDGDPDPPTEFQFCAAQHVEGSTLVCDEAFSTGVPIRLPPDEGDTVYGGVTKKIAEVGSPEVVFQTRTRTYSVPTSFYSIDPMGSLHEPDTHFAFFLFKATVTSDEVVELQSVLRIDDRVMMRPLRGLVLEGSISALFEDGSRYNIDPNVPIRVVLEDALLSELREADPSLLWLVPWPRSQLRGRVENLDMQVLGSDGSCIPSLAAAENGDPLRNELVKVLSDFVLLQRSPNMHGHLEEVFTWQWDVSTSGSNMGRGLYVGPSSLIFEGPLIFDDGSSGPHGNPLVSPSLDLRVVQGGGGPCP